MSSWVLLTFVALMVPIALVIAAGYAIVAKVLKTGGDVDRASGQESQMIQEIYHGLQRMEQRVETLETILLEREKKGESK